MIPLKEKEKVEKIAYFINENFPFMTKSEIKLYFYKDKTSNLSITTAVTFKITNPVGSEDYVYTNYVAGANSGVVYKK